MSLRLTGRGIVGHPGADSLLVEDGRVAAIGQAAEFSATRSVTHEGYLGAPRHDHHFHPFGYAGAVLGLSLKQAGDLGGVFALVRKAAEDLQPGQALIGNRLDDEALAEGRLPDRYEVDRATGDTPTLLYRYCGHAAVANSAALALAGLADHPDGVLRETEIAPVGDAVAGLRPPLAPSEAARALRGLAGLGLGKITTIVSTSKALWCEVDDEVASLLEIAPLLPLDLEVLVIADSPPDLRASAGEIAAASLPNVRFLGWKEFADGALGARTAALHEPFDDEPSNRGVLRLVPDHATTMARACLELGGTVAIHAIGDAANGAVLDLFAELIAEGAPADRLRIEHASLVTPADRERMSRLGITASVQPSFAASEVDWLPKRLGGRAATAYAWAAMESKGIRLLGGSDAPVEDPNPWPAMVAAVASGLNPTSAYRLYGPPLRVGDPAHVIETDRDLLEAATRVLSVYRQGTPIELPTPLPFA